MMDVSTFAQDEEIRTVTEPFHVIDYTQWPVVTICLTRAPLEDAEIDTFQKSFVAILKLAKDGSARVPKGKVFIMLNMDGIIEASMMQKFRAVSFISAVQEYVETSIYATALVATSTMARGILMAVLYLKPLKSVHQVFSDNTEAVKWLAMNQDRVRRGLTCVIDISSTQSGPK